MNASRVMHTSFPLVSVLVLYPLFLLGAEAVIVFGGVVPGTVLHAILVAGWLLQYVTSGQTSDTESDSATGRHWPFQLLPILALISLLRLLSVVIPVQSIPEVYWYAMIGTPLLIGVALTARQVNLSTSMLRLNPSFNAWQLAVGASGLPLGLIGYAILRPEAVISQFDWLSFVLGALIITAFTGFLEEFLFRGLLQSVASEVMGSAALLWSSTIFAIMYLGSQSVPFILFMGVVGFFFGWCFRRSMTLWGVAAAHSLMNIGLLLVYPWMFASS